MVSSFYKWLMVPVLFLLAPGARENRVVDHPFFVSVTEINHNAGTQSLELTSKLFMDDFEQVLTQRNKAVVSISKPADAGRLNALIGTYLKEHLAVKVNGRAVNCQYLGFEIEEDAVFCFMEAGNQPGVSKMEVKNTLLHDLNNDQVNILHVTVGGSRKSTKLNFPDDAASFSF